MCFFFLFTCSMHSAVISIVAIIIFWHVHDLLLTVVKLRGKGFNIPGTSFPTYNNGLSPGRLFLRGGA